MVAIVGQPFLAPLRRPMVPPPGNANRTPGYVEAITGVPPAVSALKMSSASFSVEPDDAVAVNLEHGLALGADADIDAGEGLELFVAPPEVVFQLGVGVHRQALGVLPGLQQDRLAIEIRVSAVLGDEAGARALDD